MHGTSSQFSSTNVDLLGMINWTVVGHSTCDGPRLVYHTDHQAVSTAQCHNVGSSATPDTCSYTVKVITDELVLYL